MESQNFFESWLATQNKMISNMTEAAKKMQEAVANGQITEKGTEIYKEWVANQTELVNQAKNQSAETIAKSFESTKNQSSDFFTQWFETQKKNTEKMVEASQKFFPMANTGSNPFTTWNQNSMTEGYNTWLKNWVNPFTNMMGSIPNNSAQDTFKGMLDSTSTYFKMYEVWAPFYKGMSNNQFSPANFSQFFNADKFKELMDDAFKFISPAPMKDLMDQSRAWVENLSNFSKHALSGFNTQVKEAGQHLSSAFLSDSNPFKAVLENLQRSMKHLAPGKEAELNEMYMNLIELVSKFSVKTNELQFLTYTTGQKAFEKVMQENIQEAGNITDVAGFTAFFQKWVEKSEKSFIELFNTDEYSKLQGELVELNVEIKDKTQKLNEAMLAPFPIVLKSEADELHQAIYELRKRIKELERGTNEGSDLEKKSKNGKKKPETV
jgi:class III poly(R)-hydroxyalkanoic acid synthase PhaE subunit